ncbi:MAG: M20/M25/M40 family metallo-hydrolase, partial [Acidobacteriota bacterium]
IFLLAWFVHCAPYPPETPETVATETILEADLMKHLVHIAGDETHGRAMASPGYDRAAEYLIQQLIRLGAQPGWTDESGEKVWKQPVLLERFDYGSTTSIQLSRGTEVLELRHGDGMIILNPGVPEVLISGTPLFVGYGVENPGIGWNDYSGSDLEGAIAVIMTEDPDPARAGLNTRIGAIETLEGTYERFERLSGKGVRVILAIPSQRDLWNWAATADRNSRMPLFPLERYADDQPPLLPVPWILLGREAVQFLFEDTGMDPFEGRTPLHGQPLAEIQATVSMTARVTGTSCSNVIAEIPGRDPALRHEAVIISAHLDHMGETESGIFNGANDDVSGCAAILEVMEAVQKQPFQRTLIAVFTTGEEIGHFGSLHLVRNLPVDRGQIVAALTLEHLGRIEDLDDGLEIVAPSALIRRLKAEGTWLGDSPVLWGDIERDRSGKVRGSDTQSFRVAGIPVVLLGGGTFPEYHTPEDTVDRIDLPHLRFATRVAYTIVEELGNGSRLF